LSEGTWVALAGIALSAFLGWLNYRQGKDARQEAASLARQTREDEAAAARESRLWDQRKAVYVEVCEYAYRLEDFVTRTEPIFTMQGQSTAPEFPTEEELRAQSARAAAWGSPALLAKLMELKQAAQKFQSHVWLLRFEREGMHPAGNQIEQMTVVDEARMAVKALVKEVIDLAGRELRGEH
jgi:hypothetical protein